MDFNTPTERLDTLAAYFGRRIAGELRIPCPAHKGTDDNLVLWPDAPKHRIGARCYSNGCDYKAIAEAIESEAQVSIGSGLTSDVRRTFDYPDGNKVHRVDHHNGDYAGKDITQTKGARAQGAPLYLSKPDGLLEDPRIIIVEGEAAVDRLASLGYWAATWRRTVHKQQHARPHLLDRLRRCAVAG